MPHARAPRDILPHVSTESVRRAFAIAISVALALVLVWRVGRTSHCGASIDHEAEREARRATGKRIDRRHRDRSSEGADRGRIQEDTQSFGALNEYYLTRGPVGTKLWFTLARGVTVDVILAKPPAARCAH
jgi:hypothetical protein